MRFVLRGPIRKLQPTLFAVALCFGSAAFGQAIQIGGGQIQLNGGVLFQGGMTVGDEDGGTDEELPTEVADASGAHLLKFGDGAFLHGTLESLDAGRHELRWRRDDVSAPMNLPTDQVSGLEFKGAGKRAAAFHATVKLSGGNWFTADVLGLQDGKVRLQLADGITCNVDRDRIEWIYFSKTNAPECYDGPTSMSGWVSAGGWSFHGGMLVATNPSPIGRVFDSLPDQVEYVMDIMEDPHLGNAFSIMLHGRNPIVRPQTPGSVQLMFLGGTLQMAAFVDGSIRVQQAELPPEKSQTTQSSIDKLLGLTGAEMPQGKWVRIRIYEDRLAGRIVIYLSGHKLADWKIDKIAPGENKGALTFQPLGWEGEAGHMISRIQVLPWMGLLPGEKGTKVGPAAIDSVATNGEEAKIGQFDTITPEKVTLRTADGLVDVPLSQNALLRFKHPQNPPDEDPPIAFARLVQGGEFEVTDASFHDGKFLLKTAFTGDLQLPAGTLQELHLPQHSAATPPASDEIIFQNGDRLRGALKGADDPAKIHWQLGKGGDDSEVEFGTSRMSGITLSVPSQKPKGAKADAMVHFRNGDILAGTNLKLDKDHLILKTALAGELTIARKEVQTVYFSPDNKPVIFDASLTPEECVGWPAEPGMIFDRSGRSGEKERPKTLYPWRYFNRAFSLPAGTYRASALRIAQSFDTMPQSVEFAFTATAPKNAVAFAAQLFLEENNSGYLFQLHGQGIFIYDLSPRRRVGGVQQQQIDFKDKVSPNARERKIRLFVDRPSGKLITMVDGVVVGQFTAKGPVGPRNLGRGIMLTTQLGAPCSFSDIRICPWDGLTPKTLPEKNDGDVVTLANGDETPGTVQTVDSEGVKMESDLGAIEVPGSRVTGIRFGNAVPENRPPGPRLSLGNSGALTVRTYRIENGKILCQTDLAGELNLPLSSLRELIFATAASNQDNGASKPQQPAPDKAP